MRISLQSMPHRVTDVEDTSESLLTRVSFDDRGLVGNTLLDECLPLLVHQSHGITYMEDFSPSIRTHQGSMLDHLTIAREELFDGERAEEINIYEDFACWMEVRSPPAL